MADSYSAEVSLPNKILYGSVIVAPPMGKRSNLYPVFLSPAAIPLMHKNITSSNSCR
jgi:hypothetical protein